MDINKNCALCILKSRLYKVNFLFDLILVINHNFFIEEILRIWIMLPDFQTAEKIKAKATRSRSRTSNIAKIRPSPILSSLEI